jgi:NADH:ubiquinone oxidoreductase subunit F (NADH-binding)
MPEKRVILKNCGVVDPASIESYIANDGFKALENAIKISPTDVIEEIKKSGLRGRGGAGFPTGIKWEMTGKSPGDEKYVLCNADEGEVGTFKDRYIIQNDPFSLVEGVAIAGYAVSAKKAYIYLRAEYNFLLSVLQNAIDQSREKGYLQKAGVDIEIFEQVLISAEKNLH